MKPKYLIGILMMVFFIQLVNAEINKQDAIEISKAINSKCPDANFLNEAFIKQLIEVEEEEYSRQSENPISYKAKVINLIGCEPNFVLLNSGMVFFDSYNTMIYDYLSEEERFEFYEKYNEQLMNKSASYQMIGSLNKEYFNPKENILIKLFIPGYGNVKKATLSIYYGDSIELSYPVLGCEYNNLHISPYAEIDLRKMRVKNNPGQIHFDLPNNFFKPLNQFNHVSQASLGKCVYSIPISKLSSISNISGQVAYDHYMHAAYIIQEDLLHFEGKVLKKPGNHEIVAILSYLDETDTWKTSRVEIEYHINNILENNKTPLYIVGIIFIIFQLMYPIINLRLDKRTNKSKIIFKIYIFSIIFLFLFVILLLATNNIVLTIILTSIIVFLIYLVFRKVRLQLD